MPEGHRATVDRYVRALQSGDLDAQDETLHDDFQEGYPQSGERIVGKVNRRAILRHFTENMGSPLPKVDMVMGAEDRWVLSPSFSALHISGTGDEYAVVGRATYPDGSEWHIIQLIKMKDGLIWRIRAYFGPPFEPAPWRADWVELSASVES
ncbi:MAG: nuclear transport factor 2 family protein [Candidatus Limnocylindria bacterium]